jgi:hypothetical protein
MADQSFETILEVLLAKTAKMAASCLAYVL